MDLSGRTVMVVEDHDFQRQMTLRLLKDLGAVCCWRPRMGVKR